MSNDLRAFVCDFQIPPPLYKGGRGGIYDFHVS